MLQSLHGRRSAQAVATHHVGNFVDKLFGLLGQGDPCCSSKAAWLAQCSQRLDGSLLYGLHYGRWSDSDDLACAAVAGLWPCPMPEYEWRFGD